MVSTRLTTGLVVASLGSFALSLYVQGGPHRTGAASAETGAYLAALEERLDGLEQQVRVLRAAEPLADPGPLVGTSSPTLSRRAVGESDEPTADRGERIDGVLARISSRLDAIEVLQRDVLARSPDDWRLHADDAWAVEALQIELLQGRDDFPNIDWLTNVEEALSLEQVVRLKDLAADPDADVRARLEALEALRELGGPLGIDAVDEPTALVALEMADATNAEDVRKRALASLKGSTFEFLREPLLQTAAEDTSASMRNEAVAVLGRFLPDGSIEERLRWIAENDPDPDVRDEAEDALKRNE